MGIFQTAFRGRGKSRNEAVRKFGKMAKIQFFRMTVGDEIDARFYKCQKWYTSALCSHLMHENVLSRFGIAEQNMRENVIYE